jgi:hypothetical protein
VSLAAGDLERETVQDSGDPATAAAGPRGGEENSHQRIVILFFLKISSDISLNISSTLKAFSGFLVPVR